MAKPFRVLTLQAEEEQYIPGLAGFVRLISATGPVSVWSASSDSAGGVSEGAELAEGRAYRFRYDVRGVYVKNEHTTTQTIKVVISLGDIEDSTLNGDVNATISQGTTLGEISPAAVSTTAAEVLAANANRRAVTFRNTGTNNILLGSSNVTAANAGIVLGPGEEYREAEAAAASWYAVTDAGTSTLAALEVS